VTTKHTPTPTPTRDGTTLRPRPGPMGVTDDPTSVRDSSPVTGEPSSRQPEISDVAHAGVEAEDVAALRLAEEFGDARLLLSDLRVACLLINHARHRTIARLFGVPRDQANLLTLVAVMTLAGAVNDRIQTMLRGPSVPSLGDGLLAGASLRELLRGVAGPSAGDAPLLGTLLTIGVLGGIAVPAAAKSLRATRASSQRLHVAFRHRYGYLVDPGHWRARRATRLSRSALARI
jgi:hypothetical protein